MNKLLLISALALILVISANLVSTISAREIVWTEYSDTTSVGFVIENPAEQPEQEQPCDDTDIIKEIEKDREYEQTIKETKYGSWVCINNQLQRTSTINGKQITEYNGLCGVVEKPAQKTSLDILIMLPFTLFILILILSVLIIFTLLRR